MTETWMPVSGTFRDYPLTIVPTHGWDYACLYSKGHHHFGEFCTAAEVWHRAEYDGDEFLPGVPRHEWWATRCMEPLDGCTYYTNPVGPWERGAYPVTVIDL